MKRESLATSKWNDSAGSEIPHENNGVGETPIAPFSGEIKIGEGGGASVMNFQIKEYSLVPIEFLAFTRQ